MFSRFFSDGEPHVWCVLDLEWTGRETFVLSAYTRGVGERGADGVAAAAEPEGGPRSAAGAGGEGVHDTGYEAPANEIEETLAEIWAEVLGVERVGIHDNFFELGGRSLPAVPVISRVRQILNVEVKLADMFSNTTVESLSAEAEGSKRPIPKDRAIPVRSTGSEHPLFLVPEGTGSVAYAQVLHPHIDAEVPVYALPDTPNSEPGLRTVEGMATRLSRMIRAVQPTGPYRVAGWSFGGILAYEIATQLIGQDQVVEFVGMMDTSYQAGASVGTEETEADYALLLRMLRMAEGMEESSGSSIEELVSAGPTMNLETWVRRCHETALLPDRVTLAKVQQIQNRLRANRRALREYVPQPVPISTHLFPAQRSPNPDPRRGWQALLAETSIRVTPVPGTHLSMMEASNVGSLGQALSREIRYAAENRRAVPEDDYSPLVTLQFGEDGHVPLFCVPGAGANVVSFAELTGYLDPAWPVHGLQPRGLDGKMVPHSTVSAIVECYLGTVHEVQPEGPVHLLGHSFGGWVVFEMAQRLRRAGRSVASLTILDSEVPSEDGAHIDEYNSREAFLELIDIFEQAAERSLEIGSQEIESLDETGRLRLLHERLVRFGLMPRSSNHDVLQGPFRAFSACLRATYRPTDVYPDAVRLVLVRDRKLDAEANQRQFAETVRGWKRWAPNLVFSTGAGNHITALKSPHVQSLASFLTDDRTRDGASAHGS